MLKKETFNLEDSNVAGLGSDLDKKCRSDAAATEAAWKAAGKKPGMQIWRIEKFKVKKSQTAAGTFYKDDSYICLNTYQKKDDTGKLLDKLHWDIHFWLGETTSQDEAGTAAYKTVELDDFLGGEPVQHREVCGHESNLFCGYFESSGGVQLLEGGIESGFNVVKPEEYKPRLLWLKGRKNIRVTEVDLSIESLNNEDVFILDEGLLITQWQGKKAGKNEKARAGQLCRAIDDERRGKPEVEVITQGDSDCPGFYEKLGHKGDAPEIAAAKETDAAYELDSTKTLMQLSDASGAMTFTEVAKTKITKDKLDSKDVFVFDIGCEVFVWIGKEASAAEKRNAMKFGADYLKAYSRPAYLPMTRVLEGGENEVFESSFDKA